MSKRAYSPYGSFSRLDESGGVTSTFTPHDLRRISQGVARAVKKLKFDTIACMGLSGILIAPLLAARLKKQIIVVRQEDDKVEGYFAARRYIIVDDWIDTGHTVKRIRKAVRSDWNFRKPKFIATVTYLHGVAVHL